MKYPRRDSMTRYERIRQEIIAIEREIIMLHNVEKENKDQDAYKKIRLETSASEIHAQV